MIRQKILHLILALGARFILASAEVQRTCDHSGVSSDIEDESSEENYMDEYGVPVDWDTYTLEDFWYVFQCDNVFRSPRSIHDESTWMFLRGTYLGVVGLENSSIDTNIYGHGFTISHKVSEMEGKGRGVLADEEVEEGTLLYEPRFQGCFKDQYDYRRFLVTIPHDLACDVIQWAYVTYRNENESEDDMWLCFDLDEGSYINTGKHDFEDFEVMEARKKNNKIELNNSQERKDDKLYATRHITKGEEILVDYSDFSIDGGEKMLGYE